MLQLNLTKALFLKLDSLKFNKSTVITSVSYSTHRVPYDLAGFCYFSNLCFDFKTKTKPHTRIATPEQKC